MEHDAAADAVHDAQVVELKGFARGVCSCGWTGRGLRSRKSARLEVEAHLQATAATDRSGPG